MKIIGLYGVDGSGKSTVAKMLQESLESAEYSVSHVHFRPGILARRTNDVNNITSNDTQENRSKAMSFWLKLYYVADATLFIVVCRLKRKDFLIWERPPDDCVVFPSRYRLSSNRFLDGLIVRVISIMFSQVFLYGDSSLIHSRKKELSIELIDHYNTRYRHLIKFNCVISVDNTVEKITRSIKYAFVNRP